MGEYESCLFGAPFASVLKEGLFPLLDDRVELFD